MVWMVVGSEVLIAVGGDETEQWRAGERDELVCGLEAGIERESCGDLRGDVGLCPLGVLMLAVSISIIDVVAMLGGGPCNSMVFTSSLPAPLTCPCNCEGGGEDRGPPKG
jgi:hypothetical protein